MTSPVDDDPFAPADVTPAAAEPESRKRGVTAVDGRLVNIPDSPRAPVFPGPTNDEIYIPNPDVSYDDMVSLNKEISRLRATLYRVNQSVSKAQMDAARAELAYDAAYNRAMAKISGGSEKTRQATAELLCEDLEVERKIAQIVYDRQKRMSYTVKTDLDLLANMGHNLRSQIAATTPHSGP